MPTHPNNTALLIPPQPRLLRPAQDLLTFRRNTDQSEQGPYKGETPLDVHEGGDEGWSGGDGLASGMGCG